MTDLSTSQNDVFSAPSANQVQGVLLAVYKSHLDIPRSVLLGLVTRSSQLPCITDSGRY